jgi:hypothetical protein
VIQINERGSIFNQIDLYPFKVNVFGCSRDTGKEMLPSKDAWVSKRDTFYSVQQKLKAVHNVCGVGSYRYWLRMNESYTPCNGSKFGESFRDVTTAFKHFDTDGRWFWLEAPTGTPISTLISDLLGDAKEFDILVERMDYNMYPRNRLIDSWMTRLQKNDIVDFKKDSRWVQAVVEETTETTIELRELGNFSKKLNSKVLNIVYESNILQVVGRENLSVVPNMSLLHFTKNPKIGAMKMFGLQ